MSLILFFGLAIVIFVVGVTYSGLVIRHHWRKSKEAKNLAHPSSSPRPAK